MRARSRQGRIFTEFVCVNVPKKEKRRLIAMQKREGLRSMSMLVRRAIDLLAVTDAKPNGESGPGNPSENLVALVTYSQRIALENYADQNGVSMSEAIRVALNELLD